MYNDAVQYEQTLMQRVSHLQDSEMDRMDVLIRVVENLHKCKEAMAALKAGKRSAQEPRPLSSDLPERGDEGGFDVGPPPPDAAGGKEFPSSAHHREAGPDLIDFNEKSVHAPTASETLDP